MDPIIERFRENALGMHSIYRRLVEDQAIKAPPELLRTQGKLLKEYADIVTLLESKNQPKENDQ